MSGANTMVEDFAVVQPLRPVIRAATERDCKQVEENKAKEGRTMKIAQKQIEQHGLEMKLVSVEYSFDGSKIIFFLHCRGPGGFSGFGERPGGHFPGPH